MPDPRFYRRAGSVTAAKVAEIAGAELPAGLDPKTAIADVATLEVATSRDLSYISDRSYLPALVASKAGFCLTLPDLAASVPSDCVAIPCADPRSAFAAASQALYPNVTPDWPTASAIDAAATIDPTAQIAPNAVIGAGAVIGARTKIGPHAVIGPGVVVGDDCVIGANVTLTFCLIGHRVLIHPGVQIGQDGFGFTAGPRGPVKVPQLGRVVIHDEVEIGANCTIDRGSLADTVIGRGCKFDNLVQVAHNVVFGQGCMVVAQAGVAGSCVIGDGVIIGPQVGVIDHINVGAGARIAGQSGVNRDVAPKETVMGYPAKPIRQFWREIAALAGLAKRG